MMSKNNAYQKKRNFNQSPEPKSSEQASSGEKPIFVIQKHDASNLHYDFRLEIEGVLKSWAVPKGPSTDPSDKRLAIPTEDHPIEYAHFEGLIPEGQYGAGTVMIWDQGTYRNIKTNNGKTVSMKESYKNGQLEIYLEGQKLTGGYALVHTGSDKMDDNWLLIKKDDDEADARRKPTSTENRSAETGRDLKQIEEQEDE